MHKSLYNGPSGQFIVIIIIVTSIPILQIRGLEYIITVMSGIRELIIEGFKIIESTLQKVQDLHLSKYTSPMINIQSE